MIIDAALTTIGIALGTATLIIPTLAARAALNRLGTSPTGWRLRARRSARRLRRAPG